MLSSKTGEETSTKEGAGKIIKTAVTPVYRFSKQNFVIHNLTVTVNSDVKPIYESFKQAYYSQSSLLTYVTETEIQFVNYRTEPKYRIVSEKMEGGENNNRNKPIKNNII